MDESRKVRLMAYANALAKKQCIKKDKDAPKRQMGAGTGGGCLR